MLNSQRKRFFYHSTPGRSNLTQKLVGYTVAATVYNPTSEATDKLLGLCDHRGFKLDKVDWDPITSAPETRLGFWRAIRSVLCTSCHKQMPKNFESFSDYIDEVLGGCACREPEGLDGLMICNANKLNCDAEVFKHLLLRLGEMGKHVYSEDGVCHSCCSPAVRAFLWKREVLVGNFKSEAV